MASYDSVGGFRWARSAGSSNLEQGLAIATDGSNVYVAGYRNTSLSFSPTVGLVGPGGFLVKYDMNGTLLWAQNLGSQPGAFPSSVATDNVGNCIVGGFLGNGMTMAGQVLAAPLNTGDYFVASFSPSGQGNWARAFSTPNRNPELGPSAVAADGQGNAYFTGTFLRGSLRLTPTLQLTTFENYAMCLVKLDNQGNVVWARQAGLAAGLGLAIDDLGAVLATGMAENGATFSVTPLTTNGTRDAYLARYGTNGTLRWVRTCGGPRAPDAGRAVAVNLVGDAFVAVLAASYPGTFGSNTITWPSDNNRTVVVKYDTTGTVRWVAATDGPTSPPKSIALVSSNRPIVAIQSSYLPVIFGAYFAAPVGNNDIMLAKVRSNQVLAATVGKEMVQLQLHPNPARDFVTIATPTTGRARLQVLDLQGRVVYAGELNQTTKRFSVSGWPKGIYIVQLVAATGTSTRKLVVE